MARITFGGRELLRAARRFEEGLLDKISDIVYETARLIQTQAKALAPVDDGSLRDSIEMKMLGKFNAIVTVGVHYAIYVEYGTGIYAQNGNGRRTPWTYYSLKLGRYVTTEGMKAQQFWGPAVDAGQEYFKTEMRRLGL
ncbi:HK97-gp10 family putative phage morphogenesis protein [Lysinibacillus sp. ACHW1.5]|uniref:HK97-gp10 family putative phage morphogenesis protein n=1 Tax=Lysinibacillus sp. ACHW1.5 TaxID=2913506 RepID=UPI001EDC8D22|nr:HK97-gp10 family putative phage morphogenesis protein [Lysinibacillus sp. ACHW1.5]UKJ44291.1 HK97 gp10 family phage protein [Lysinibacillus sp. ACHW1.5]